MATPSLPRLPTSGIAPLDRLQTIWLSVLNPVLGKLGQNGSWNVVGSTNQPPFQNGWTNAAQSGAPAGWMVDYLGCVHLRGTVSLGTGTIFALPTEVAPPWPLVFAVSANGAFGEVTVGADGKVTLTAGSGPLVSLAGISFDRSP